MSRNVLCRKYKTELPGLIVAPYPGPKGQEIYETVSKQAWQEWQAQQTMLINEKQLSLKEALPKNRGQFPESLQQQIRLIVPVRIQFEWNKEFV